MEWLEALELPEGSWDILGLIDALG